MQVASSDKAHPRFSKGETTMKRLHKLVLTVLLVIAISGCMLVREPAQRPSLVEWPTAAWRTSTPEEQGIDAAKLAEGLLAMREQGIDIHSLLIIRNGVVVVDAYFHPYDGKTVHNQASVTKSIMTTLIGMAADQGKLTLDDPPN
jgi:CubicO group peptidase (beta-lactamase class C family)